MKKPTLWPGLVLLIALTGAGCDNNDPAPPGETARSRITFDLGSLNTASLDGALVECQSVVSSVALFIDGELSAAQVVEPGQQVNFIVEVDIGLVNFTAQVLSNNETVLFDDRITQMIEGDGFVVDLIPQPVNPVLEVCVDADQSKFEISNRGIGDLAWQIVPPPPVCGMDMDQPCLTFDSEMGTVPEGGFTTVIFDILGDEPGPFTGRVESEVGAVGFVISPIAATARQEQRTAGESFLSRR